MCQFKPPISSYSSFKYGHESQSFVGPFLYTTAEFQSVCHKFEEEITNLRRNRMIQQVVPLYFMLVTRHLEVGRRRFYLVLGSILYKTYYCIKVLDYTQEAMTRTITRFEIMTYKEQVTAMKIFSLGKRRDQSRIRHWLHLQSPQ